MPKLDHSALCDPAVNSYCRTGSKSYRTGRHTNNCFLPSLSVQAISRSCPLGRQRILFASSAAVIGKFFTVTSMAGYLAANSFKAFLLRMQSSTISYAAPGKESAIVALQ